MKNDVKCTRREENQCVYGHIFLALKTSMSISSDSENIFADQITVPYLNTETGNRRLNIVDGMFSLEERG
jgi:hypothetical protein